MTLFPYIRHFSSEEEEGRNRKEIGKSSIYGINSDLFSFYVTSQLIEPELPPAQIACQSVTW